MAEAIVPHPKKPILQAPSPPFVVLHFKPCFPCCHWCCPCCSCRDKIWGAPPGRNALPWKKTMENNTIGFHMDWQDKDFPSGRYWPDWTVLCPGDNSEVGLCGDVQTVVARKRRITEGTEFESKKSACKPLIRELHAPQLSHFFNHDANWVIDDITTHGWKDSWNVV